MIRLVLFFLIVFPSIGFTQINALITLFPACGSSCNGGALIDFEDIGNNPPYEVSVYFDNTDPFPDLLLGSESLNSNDTSIFFSNFCSFSTLKIIIADASGDSSIFIANAPYSGLQGWLHDCVCIYEFASAGAYGGFPPYTFNLYASGVLQETLTSSTSVLFDSLTCGVGSLMVTISDMNGCIALYTPLIDAPCNAPNPGCDKEVYLTLENVSDSSLCDGVIIWEIEGVDTNTEHQLIITSWAGYNDTLILAPGVLTDTLYNLCPSYYTFKLDKDSSCFDFTSGQVKYPQPIVHTSFLSADPINECTHCGNTIEWSFQDYYVNAPYQIYLLDASQTILDSSGSAWNNFSGAYYGMCEGNYQVLVVDGDGDSLSTFVQVTDPPNVFSLDSTILTHTNTAQSTGAIELFVSGGYPAYQYSIDGGITWQTDSLFGGLASGNYSILVMDSSGCIISTSVTLIDGDVGLTESEILFEIFPNPTEGTLTLHAQGAHLFVITDLQGQIIHTGALSDQHKIDLSNEPKGVYLISIQSDQITSTRLLIIQ